MTQAVALTVIGLVSLAFITYTATHRSVIQSSSESTYNTVVYPAATVLVSMYVSGFNRLNASAVIRLYTNTSVVDWKGVSEPWSGKYYASDGSAFVRIHNFLQGTTSLNLTATDPSESGFGPTSVNVSFVLGYRQSNVLTNTDNATVSVQQEWVQQGNTWLVQNDTWDYLTWSGMTPHSQ